MGAVAEVEMPPSLASRPPAAADQEIAGVLTADSVASGTATSCDILSPARLVIAEALDDVGTPSTSSTGSWRWSLPPYPINTSPADATPTSKRSADGGDEGPLFAFVLALLAIVGAALGGILPDAKDTVAGWSTAPKVVYGVAAALTIALLAVGVMAAACHAATAGGNRAMLLASAFCAKLGAVLCSAILVVSVSCKLGRWGCVAGVPSAAVVAGVMAAVWIWGDERAAAQAVSSCWRRVENLRRQHRRRYPAGDELV